MIQVDGVFVTLIFHNVVCSEAFEVWRDILLPQLTRNLLLSLPTKEF